MSAKDISCNNSICDSFLFNHTFNYASTKIKNVVELNTDVGNVVCLTTQQVKGFKLPQPNSYNNNNRNYRCEFTAWNPAQKAGQQQTMSTKMRQSKRLQNIKRGGKTVYY